jgi:phosphoglycolate phosphatase
MLILFDIDGTLLDSTLQSNRDAVAAALKEVHGVDTSAIATPIETDGRTDGEIARAILGAAGVGTEQINARAKRVQESTARWSARLLPADLSFTVLPGVRELLACLTDRPEMTPALLTGNFEAVGRLKLARAGIGDAFAPGQGAFGSDDEDRLALPAIARRRAGAAGVAGVAGAPYPRAQTIVIGDTPRDIACARADGLRCVAVASGPFTRDALAEADVVAGDAFELPRILLNLEVQ